jgi:hypothetical protein
MGRVFACKTMPREDRMGYKAVSKQETTNYPLAVVHTNAQTDCALQKHSLSVTKPMLVAML